MEKTYQRIISLKNILVKGLLGGIFLLVALLPCSSDAQTIRLISDEETEQYLAEILLPLYKAAGINFYRNKMVNSGLLQCLEWKIEIVFKNLSLK